MGHAVDPSERYKRILAEASDLSLAQFRTFVSRYWNKGNQVKDMTQDEFDRLLELLRSEVAMHQKPQFTTPKERESRRGNEL